jgi:HSP20 family protein
MSQQRPTETVEPGQTATQATEHAEAGKEEKGTTAKMARARPQERALGRTGRHAIALSTSPFSMVRRFMDEMDRVFSDFFSDVGFRSPSILAPLTPLTLTPFPSLSQLETAVWSPVIETFEPDGRLVFRAELPGLDKNDVNVEIDGDQLVISGERTESEEQRRGGRVYSERCYGAFERRITLPEGCDVEDVEASYENGVLEVSIPKPEEARPQRKRIQIKGKEEPTKEGETQPVH